MLVSVVGLSPPAAAQGRAKQAKTRGRVRQHSGRQPM